MHYRDAPFLLTRRYIAWSSLSLVLHSLILVGVSMMIIERVSAVWWLALALGALPALTGLRYALIVTRHPLRVVKQNKRKLNTSDLVP